MKPTFTDFWTRIPSVAFKCISCHYVRKIYYQHCTKLPTSQAGPVTRVTSPRLPLFAITAATLARPRALQLPLALGTSPLLYLIFHS